MSSSIPFWTRNMSDHALFVYDTLSPAEQEARQRAAELVRAFDRHLSAEQAEAAALVRDIRSLREFLLQLLRRQLGEGLGMLLTPTTVNHMITEGDEAVRILQAESHAEHAKRAHPMLRHLVWLPVLSADAFVIQGAMDPLEKGQIALYQDFARDFEELHRHASELTGYMRTGLTDFPALSRFRSIVRSSVEAFLDSFETLTRLQEENAILDKLPIFYVEHVYREAEYYLGAIMR